MEYMESRMQDQIEGAQHTYASMCEEIERLGNALAERQAHWRDAMAEAARLRAELQHIADAKPATWDDPTDFRAWAQNRAQHALKPNAGVKRRRSEAEPSA